MVPTTNPSSRLLLVSEVAERLRKNEQAIRWMVYKKQIIPPAKIGGRLCWREDQLEAWIESQFEKASA